MDCGLNSTHVSITFSGERPNFVFQRMGLLAMRSNIPLVNPTMNIITFCGWVEWFGHLYQVTVILSKYTTFNIF